VTAMRRGKRTQLVVLSVLVLASARAASVFTPNASAVSGQKADQAVRALFNASLVRAEIVTATGSDATDYRISRGIVRRVRPRFLTLAERDGKIALIAISPSTRITVDGKEVKAARLQRGMRATALQNGVSRATWIDIAKKQPDGSLQKIRSLLTAHLVRTEVISLAGGLLRDSRADIGVIENVDESSLTLGEIDGTVVDMQFDTVMQVQINNKSADVTDLSAGMRATTLGPGDGTVSRIWVSSKTAAAKGGGKKK
jgi:hypothetical protein